jgi:Arc/MetJ family transcription regulator
LLLEETSQGWLGSVVIMRMFGHDSTKSMRQDISIDSIAMARAIAAVDVEGVSSAIHTLPHRTLNATERDQADSLAAWLWARRCGRPGG